MSKRVSCIIFDLDGTIYRGDEVIPGAVDFVLELQQRGIRVMFYTNRAHKTPIQIADKLKSMNLPVQPDQVITSAIVTAHVLGRKRIFCIGLPALVDALKSERAVITDENPEFVVLGYVDTLEMDELTKAVQFITEENARFVATNLDPYILVEGKRVPENGVLAAAVQEATGKSPLVYGKPDPAGIHMIMEKYQLKSDEVMIVGDTLSTDIRCGVQAGIRSALLLTGVTSAQQAVNTEAELVVENYKDLRQRILGS